MAIAQRDFTEQEEQGLVLVAEAEDLKVVDQDSFDKAAEMLKSVKAYLAEVKRITAPVVAAAHTAWKAALGQQQGLEANALEAERILKKSLGVYEQAQKDEADRINERIRAEAEEADRRARAAAKEAGVVMPPPAQPVVVFTPPPPPVPKARGVAFADQWKFEVTDPALVPAEYKIVDEKKIGAVVRALKGQTVITGVRVYSERGVRA